MAHDSYSLRQSADANMRGRPSRLHPIHKESELPVAANNDPQYAMEMQTTKITSQNFKSGKDGVYNETFELSANDVDQVQVAANNNVPHVNVTSQSQPVTPTSHEAFFYVQIAFFAMCGCLSRIGTDRLFGNVAGIEDPGEIVNQSFFSNIVGCFVLGALNGSPMGKTTLAALYKGLTTGYCGSYTTWSKWNQQLSLTLVGETDTHGAQSQVLSIASWFIGFYTYIGSYQVGLDFGKTVGNCIGDRVIPKGPWIADRAVLGLLVAAYIGFIVGTAVDVSQNSKVIWLSVLFAPFGACLRAYLSKYKVDKYMLPLGTFIANVLGAVILAALHVLNTRTNPCKDLTDPDVICWATVVISAVGTGFCACLTTISTFMSEICKIRDKVPVYAYGYAIFTVVVCQVLCGIINGVNLNHS